MARAIVSLPATARRGEIVEVRTLVSHVMETGFRRTQLGELIARDIVTRFSCTYNGAEVFRAEFHPAISANPLLTFSFVATDSGKVECRWSGDKGFAVSESATITVS